MDDNFEQLSAALGRAIEPLEPSHPDRLKELAELKPLPMSPLAAWVVLEVVLHEERQKWVTRVARTELADRFEDLSGIDPLDAFHDGIVPGMPEWNYTIRDGYCCLTDRVSGQTIQVNLDDPGEINSEYFTNYLLSLTSLSFVEFRIISFGPDDELIKSAFTELVKLGLLKSDDPMSMTVRLTPRIRKWRKQIVQLNDKCGSKEGTAQAAAALGDWRLVQKLAGDADGVNQLVERHLGAQAHRFMELLKHPETAIDGLYGLIELDVPEARAALKDAFSGSNQELFYAAISIATSLVGEDWTTEISQALRALKSDGEDIEADNWGACARYLLQRGCRTAEIREGLRQSSRRGRAALLAHEFYTEIALELYRTALRSESHDDRATASAIFVILNQAWCHAELQDVLNESDDEAATQECRSALNALPHAELHEFVLEWEARNLSEPDSGSARTIEHKRVADRDLQNRIEELHDRVLPLRNRPLVPSSS
jgi:hypothetical protein